MEVGQHSLGDSAIECLRLLLHGLDKFLERFRLLEFVVPSLSVDFPDQVCHCVIVVVHLIESLVIQNDLLSADLLHQAAHGHSVNANQKIDENGAKKLVNDFIPVQIFNFNQL